MRCRFCNAFAEKIGSYEPYPNLLTEVFQCGTCGIRQTPLEKGIHERLHREPTAYMVHDELASRCHDAFVKGDRRRLREVLCQDKRFRFVIEASEVEPGKRLKVAEIGCSRGALSSYFILMGYDFTGMDISEVAVEAAGNRFGRKYFCNLDTWKARDPREFDVIYHTGTIGCVDRPLEMTEDLLSRLVGRGRLLFNAPNVEACVVNGQLWVEGTHPPDLVTLFPPGIWERTFCQTCHVDTQVLYRRGWSGLTMACRIWSKRDWVWRADRALVSVPEAKASKNRRRLMRNFVRKLFQNIVDTVSPRLLDQRWPTDFGVFVVLTKK